MNNSESSPSATLLEGNFLTSKDMSNQTSLYNQNESSKMHRRFNSNNENKAKAKKKNISILDMGLDYDSYGKENKEAKIRFNTTHNMLPESVFEMQPQPVTSKTIDQMMARRESEGSEVYSINEMSYTESVACSGGNLRELPMGLGLHL